MNANKDVTGRDRYITALALAYAIVTIERLPKPYQARGDLDDMFLLLANVMPDERTRAIIEDEVARKISHASGETGGTA